MKEIRIEYGVFTGDLFNSKPKSWLAFENSGVTEQLKTVPFWKVAESLSAANESFLFRVVMIESNEGCPLDCDCTESAVVWEETL